jgi:tetratricopeptide (TPR) repeat protein
MARIYISSTYGDLKEHREKAYRVLRQLGHDAVAMEDYVATDRRPLAKCLADVAACDLYVGIFAHSYGYVPKQDNPDERSITELEYRHAAAHGIPCLIFLLSPDIPWLPGWMDAFTGEGDHGARIRSLREELGRERLVSFFSTADELAKLVGVSVTTQSDYQLVTGLPSVAVVRGWTIPTPVRSFTGRDKQLDALRTQLTGQGAAALVPTAALYGLGGVGKTQLALAYAKRHREDYQLGWWIPAETQLGMITALADLAGVLGLRRERTPAELAARVRDALAERSGWLLIFDNAPDPGAVAEFLPVAGGGHVLLTSRDPAWQGIAEPVSVDLLTSDEAVQLLIGRSGDGDRQAAARLADAVDRLPLALEQASAYVAQQHLTLARYLELFDQRRAELLARGKPLAYQGTVDATFTLTIQQLRERNAAAVQLLELCALLAPDELPLDLLLSAPHRLPEPLATAAQDPLQRHETVAALFAAGVLTKDTGGTARMHRLIQAVTLDHLHEPERKQHVTEAVELMAELFPYEGYEPDRWHECAQLLLHAQTLIDHAPAAQLGMHDLARLLTSVGIYLYDRSLDRRLARQMHEQALAMYRQLYEGDNVNVANGLNNLATDLGELGDYRRARELHEQALAMRQRLYEGDHPDVAASMNNLAIDLRQAGEDERARELDEQALAMRQRLHEGDHPHVATSMNDLAIDLRRAGEHKRARELAEQALAMRQRLYEGDHPDVANSMTNLAIGLRRAGEHERARELDEQALAMRQRLAHG